MGKTPHQVYMSGEVIRHYFGRKNLTCACPSKRNSNACHHQPNVFTAIILFTAMLCQEKRRNGTRIIYTINVRLYT
jgi:hypothetical protein